jgi:hypothetical protein
MVCSTAAAPFFALSTLSAFWYLSADATPATSGHIVLTCSTICDTPHTPPRPSHDSPAPTTNTTFSSLATALRSRSTQSSAGWRSRVGGTWPIRPAIVSRPSRISRAISEARLMRASSARTTTGRTTENTEDTETEGEEERVRILDPDLFFLSGLCVLCVLCGERPENAVLSSLRRPSEIVAATEPQERGPGGNATAGTIREPPLECLPRATRSRRPSSWACRP